jgi:hypothetical protein
MAKRFLTLVLLGFISLVRPPLAFAETAIAQQLVAALALTDAQAKELDGEALLSAADALHSWSMLGNRSPVTGSTAKYIAALEKSFKFYRMAHQKAPKHPKILWKHAFANYTLGELLPDTDKKRRAALYEEMIALTDQCLQDFPKEAGCWHFKAVGMGRLATTKGILSSMMAASDIEEMWLKSIDLSPTDVHPWGDPLLPGVEYAAAVFYRLVPDMWIVKVAIGTRGDKKKSVAFMRKAVAAQPYRLELQKELAVSLTCLGYEKDDGKALAEGKGLFQKIIAGEFDREDIRATDVIDKRHAADMLAKPELACKYSRDGYQEVDMEKAEKQFKK